MNKKQGSIKQVNRKRIQKIFSTGLLQQFAFCSSPPTIQTEATPMPHLSWLAKSSSLASSSQLSSQTFTVVSSTPFDSASDKKLINQQEFCMHAFVFHYFERFRNIVLFMGKIVHNLVKMMHQEVSTILWHCDHRASLKWHPPSAGNSSNSSSSSRSPRSTLVALSFSFAILNFSETKVGVNFGAQKNLWPWIHLFYNINFSQRIPWFGGNFIPTI